MHGQLIGAGGTGGAPLPLTPHDAPPGQLGASPSAAAQPDEPRIEELMEVDDDDGVAAAAAAMARWCR